MSSSGDATELPPWSAAEKKGMSRFARFGLPAILVAVAVAAYANSFSGTFFFDDQGSITENPTIRSLWPFLRVLGPPETAGTGGRPLLNLSFAVNFAAGGLSAWGYHAFNLAIHILAGLTLFGLLCRTLAPASAPLPDASLGTADVRLPEKAFLTPAYLAFAIALIWLVHPLQTEAVTYVSERAESMMGLFYLLTLYCFIRLVGKELPTAYERESRAHSATWGVLSIAACLCGMATKEVTVTAPFVVLLYDRTFVCGTFREALGRRWKYYLGLAGTWLLLGFLLRDVGKRGVGSGFGVRWWQYGLEESRIVLRYLALAVWPHPLILDYGSGAIRQTWAVAPYVAAVLVLLGATVWSLFHPATKGTRWRFLGFAGAWFFVLLAPTSSIVAVAGQPMAEHRMYLPLAAIVSMAAFGLAGILGRRFLPAAILLAALLTGVTLHRNADYRTSTGMWFDTIAKCPENERAHNNLGYDLSKMPGRLDEAIAQYQAALRIKPDYPEAHDNLGNAYFKKGRTADAVSEFEEALRHKPDFASAHNNLGNVLYTLGRTREAVSEHETALRINPDYAEAHNDLGCDLDRIPGRSDDAIDQYRTALRLKPDFAEAHDNLGNALRSRGRLDEAVAQYREAIRLNPLIPEVHKDFGLALDAAKEFAAATAEYEEALRLKPDFAEAHNDLGLELEKLPGRLEDAIAQYRAAISLNPDFVDAHSNLGNALNAAGRASEAIVEHEEALRLKPDLAETHNSLGCDLEKAPGRSAEAIGQFEEALRLKPDFIEAEKNLANALNAAGRTAETIREYKAVLRLDPGDAEMCFNLACELEKTDGGMQEAADRLGDALRLKPDFIEARSTLGDALRSLGRVPEAIAQYQEVLRRRPDIVEVHNNLAIALDSEGRIAEAIAQYREALRLKPDYAAIHMNLAGEFLKKPGGNAEAAAELETVLRLQPANELARQILGKLRSPRP